MKKILTTFTIFVVLFSCFAVEIEGYEYVFDYQRPETAINSKDLNYALFVDSTVLSEKKIAVSFPVLSINADHFATYLPTYSKLIEDIKENGINNIGYGDLMEFATEFLDKYPGGTTDLFNTGVSFGFQIDHFAFGFNAQVNLTCTTNSADPEVYNFYVIPSAIASVSLAYGNTLYDGSILKIDGGVAVHAKLLAFTEKVGVSKIMEITKGEVTAESILESVGADVGVGVSPDLRLSFNFYDEVLGLDLGVSNLYGVYRMWSVKDASQLTDFDAYKRLSDHKTYPVGNLFLSFDPIPNYIRDKYFDFRLRVGFADVVLHNFKSFNVMDLIDFKVNMSLFGDWLDCFSEFKYGYFQCGAGLNIYGNRLEVFYGWHEEGESLGEKPVDSLTVKCTLGYQSKKGRI